MGVTHLDEAPAREYAIGHIRGRWTMLGEAAGCQTVGVRRIELPAGGWSTPAHEHGRSEEIFYVLGGSGLSWCNGATAPIRAGDGIVYLARGGAHTLQAGSSGLDVLAFGTREYDETLRLPRLEMSMLGNRAVESVSGAVDGVPIQHVREGQLGPPPLPAEVGARPSTIVNLDELDAVTVARARVERTRRNFGRAAGSRRSGLQHVTVAPGRESTAMHCHSLEEEVFVILSGDGTLVLANEETAIGPGSVVCRPAATGIAHVLRAGSELTYLAYGTRDPGDICYYPRSNKIAFRGVGVMARLERIEDYWDGED